MDTAYQRTDSTPTIPVAFPSRDATHVPQLLQDDLIQLMGGAVMTLVARESL